MNYFIISDLHIDTGDTFGTFGWSPDEFIDTLEHIRENYPIDKIILNGDIYELYKYSFEEIKNSQRRLVEYLNSEDFIYIRGNHDFISPYGRDYYLHTNSQGKTIYIEHGHKADFLNGTRMGRFIGTLFFHFLKGLIFSKILRNVYFKIVEYDEGEKVVRKYNSYKYLKYALRLLKTYDVVVLGHTHKIEVHKTYYLNSKKRYLNTGSCSLGRLQGIFLNTETLKYETLKISKEDIKKLNRIDLEMPTPA